jgi:thiol-disulfide isomerase/thioredoxin
MTDDLARPPSGARRRTLLMAGVGGVAAVAGGAAAWWKFRPRDVQPGALDGLWGLDFPTPSGGTLHMAQLKGRPVLVNFWATWCPPCVEELPLLDRFYREQSANGWQVVGLAIDQPSSVRTFLGRLPVSFPIGLAGLEGTELGKSLGNLNGGLPFTVVIGRDGTIAQRKMGKVDEADLAQWIQAAGASS